MKNKNPLFVVQKHKARNMHYDFRMEISGVLKSWAIPKGPTLNPSMKRLAVQVEDHPLSYIHFEGTIPEGDYGAGEVIVWDKGECVFSDKKTPAKQYEDGDLTFELKGHKLKGGYKLLRTNMPGKNDSWLLIKRNDEFVSYGDILIEKPGSVISLRNI